MNYFSQIICIIKIKSYICTMLKQEAITYSLLGYDTNLKINNFPDGQRSVEVLNPDMLHHFSSAIISLNFTNFADLELLGSLILVLKRYDVDDITLYCPYLLGARSDRRFNLGDENYLRMVLEVIKNLGVKHIQVLDLHNPSAHATGILPEVEEDEMSLQNITLDELLLFKQSEIDHILNYVSSHDVVVIVAPDAGASDRAEKFKKFLEKYMGKDIYSICLEKTRTTEGITIVPSRPILTTTRDLINKSDNALILTVDDICDGGGTFLASSEALKKFFPTAKQALFVTHGIFSKGVQTLLTSFDRIITTNSYTAHSRNLSEKISLINVY